MMAPRTTVELTAGPPDRFAALDAAVSELPTASMELMAERELQSRQDWKFVVPLNTVEQLLERIAGEHAVLTAGAERLATYDTQYFDTPDFRFFHDHRRGRPRRFKVRARDYVDRRVTVVEVKARQPNGETLKTAHPTSFGDHQMAGPAWDFVREQVGDKPLIPTLRTCFYRISLLGLQAEERITMDVGLEFVRGSESVAVAQSAIVEIKSASPRRHTRAMDHARVLRMRPESFSKYCVGVSLLYPHLRTNTFRPTLRNLTRMERR